MPEARRQHYVPQFYLRNFSIGNEGKAVGMFNINSDSFIPCASLRDQAYRDFFYGKDGRVERVFAKLEGIVAGIVADILRTSTPPAIQSEEHLQLLIFTLFLHHRTLYAAEAMNELFDKTVKWDFSKEHPEMEDTLRQFAIELRSPVSWTLSMMENGLPLASDLHCKLLVNCTEVPLATSDNPAVFYNQFLETRKAFGSGTGLACKGLQVLLPLSPKHLLHYYDGDVYKVGDKRQRVILVKNDDDINALNVLQCASAHANIYFDGSIAERDLRKAVQAACRFRPKTMAHVCAYPQPSHDRDNLVSASVCYTENIKCNLQLSFISVVKRARSYSAGDRVKHVRDETVFELDREFRNLMSRGIVQDGQFGYFLATKGGAYGKRARSIMSCFRNLAA